MFLFYSVMIVCFSSQLISCLKNPCKHYQCTKTSPLVLVSLENSFNELASTSAFGALTDFSPTFVRAAGLLLLPRYTRVRKVLVTSDVSRSLDGLKPGDC